MGTIFCLKKERKKSDDGFMMRRRRRGGQNESGLFGDGGFGLFFGLHPAVLEPDFDLALSQAEGVGDLDSPASGQVAIKVELLFQFQRLVAGVRLASSLWIRHHI